MSTDSTRHHPLAPPSSICVDKARWVNSSWRSNPAVVTQLSALAKSERGEVIVTLRDLLGLCTDARLVLYLDPIWLGKAVAAIQAYWAKQIVSKHENSASCLNKFLTQNQSTLTLSTQI